MKEYFMKFFETTMTILSYPYDMCLVILAALNLVASFLVVVFAILIRGLVIIGHGTNFEETLHFKDAFKWISKMHEEINYM